LKQESSDSAPRGFAGSAVKFLLWSLRTFFRTKYFFAGVAVGLLVGFSGAMYFNVSRSLANLWPNLSFLDQFSSEQITYKFRSYVTKLSGKQSLYVARLEQLEIFERTSHATYFWMRLPDVIAKVEVPVEYNYYVSLQAPWSFERRGNHLIIHVPELSSSAPAANVSLMKLGILKGSFLRDEKSAKENLLKELNGILIENAIAARVKVRAQARLAVKEFVSEWLVKSAPREALDLTIDVRFPDEELATIN
jgi:hypothetical protein